MKRLLLIFLAAIALANILIVGTQVMHDPANEQASMPAPDPAAQLARGEYLARAGNCMGCHTVRGGKQYAGGRAIATPFGDLYAPNLTPDETGLGKWSKDDFWRAIHNGKSRDGSFLYPAFPFPNYTKVTRADADAMFAYLQALPPIRQENRPNALRLPYNQRILLAYWRTLYFRAGPYRNEPDRSPQWNRGAYLVQGLGHCSACHTARNAMGASVAEARLGGGVLPVQNWYAPALAGNGQGGLGDWSEADIAEFLHAGVSRGGAAFGPMAEVVSKSLQHLDRADIDAMASYLKSVSPSQAMEDLQPLPQVEDSRLLEQGAKLYEQQCASCHGADGKGAAPAYPSLAGKRALAPEAAMNQVRMVLNGGYPPGTTRNPRPYGMPPFGSALSDGEIAAVVSYIRASWGNQGSGVAPDHVARLRGTPIQ